MTNKSAIGSACVHAAGFIPLVRCPSHTEFLRTLYGANEEIQKQTIAHALAPFFSPAAAVPNLWCALMLYEGLLVVCGAQTATP